MDLHYSVFHREIRNFVASISPIVCIDCTFGRGGHSEIVLQAHDSNVVLAGDQDMDAIHFAREKFKHFGNRFSIFHQNFSQINSLLEKISEDKKIFILADLGISSPQIDQAERGFSFRFPEQRLDFRMDITQGLPAWKVLPTLKLEELSECLRSYGEIKFHRSIAAKILETAKEKEITFGNLISICRPYPQRKDNHLVTLVSQAIRIFINDELKSLDQLLIELNNPRWEHRTMVAAFISFHSLEDRVLKRRAQQQGWKKIKFLKEVSPEELKENPRSGSAKLRIYEV